MIEVLSWYVIITLLGFLVLPLSFLIFHRLPDRGYSFSKPLGLLLVSMVAWWLGNLNVLPFTQFGISLVIALVGLFCVGLPLLNRKLGDDLLAWFGKRANLKLILASELVFLAAFAFMVNFRSYMPALDRSEKFFDLAFINAIATSPSLPPPDPWFGGLPMNYYYGGQMLMAVMVKLSGVAASTGYNIGMGLTYALATVAAFGLVSNLIGIARNKGLASPAGGLLGATFLMVLGNLYPLRQVLTKGFEPFGSQNFPFYVDWPASARMIYDPMPDGRKLDILTEYPIYSYLNGDLHAHLLDAPFVLLALGFALHLFSAPAKWALARPHWRTIPAFLAGGLLVGALCLVNGGDFPTYLVLTLAVLLLAEFRAGGPFYRVAGRWLTQAAGLGAGIYLVYLWFFTNFTGMVKAIPLPEWANVPLIGFLSRYLNLITWPRTLLAEYVLMFGLFLLSLLVFMGLKLGQVWREEEKYFPPLSGAGTWLVRVAGVLFLATGAATLGPALEAYQVRTLGLQHATLPVAAFSAAAWTLLPGAWRQLRQRPRLAIEGMIFLLLLVYGPLIKFELLGPAAALTYFALRLLWREMRGLRRLDGPLSRVDALVLLFVALAGALTLFCEIAYIRDIYSNRFNTMMKFWYQLWVLNGLAGTYATWRAWNWGRLPGEALEPADSRSEGLKLLPGQPRPSLPGALAALLNPWWMPGPLRPVAGGPELDRSLNLSAALPRPSQPSERPGGHPDLHPVEKPAGGRFPGRRYWKAPWLAVLSSLCLVGLLLPTVAYYQATNHYQLRVGLDGEAWYAQVFPHEYPAMKWLRDYTTADPARRGVVLEANGMNYSLANRVSTFTGLPTVVGWPFHELQWRGYLDDKVIWEGWLDMGRIYETTDNAQALEMLKRRNVRYVFVGQVENGSASISQYEDSYKRFSPDALAKFGQFMRPIYSDPANKIYIYEMK